jgi:hypothetical protein
VHLDRIKEGAELFDAFRQEPGPWFALWLQCELYPAVWHLGVAFREVDDATITRMDQTDEGLRAAKGVSSGARWWVLLSTDRPTLNRVRVAIQRLLRTTDRPLTYGRIYLGGVIDGQGRYHAAPGETGLSCVGLVLAVFEGIQWPLVDRPSWTGRTLPPAIAEAVERELNSEERERFVNDHGALVLPSEIAGACLFELPRVPLSNARLGAEHFEELARLRAHATAS